MTLEQILTEEIFGNTAIEELSRTIKEEVNYFNY